MTKFTPDPGRAVVFDLGIRALCGIASFHGIAADPFHLERELALAGREAGVADLIRGSRLVGLKARVVRRTSAAQLETTPWPAIVQVKDRGFAVLVGRSQAGAFRLIDTVTRIERHLTVTEVLDQVEPDVILIGRRAWTPEGAASRFGLGWFLPSLWRYRKPLGHVLLASLFVQILALTTPLFFQVVVDKVLAHRSLSTLYVLVAGFVISGLFDVLLQYQRAYALHHTTNRIDVELGQRLFRHLLRLPLGYFETRPAGQTVARMRELETIRAFLTGQGLFSALDLAFAVAFIGVLFAYSGKLTLIVVAAMPFYVLLAVLIRPSLVENVQRKFATGAAGQQFLVETVVGMQTVKSAAVEPLMAFQWEERLAAYVKTSFAVNLLAALGQNGVQLINRVTTAGILLFGAKAVMNDEMTVGGLVAFNMLAAHVTQPVLRLAQLWQDFQQVRISAERVNDILNTAPEPTSATPQALPPPRGRIDMEGVNFRYRSAAGNVLKGLNLSIAPGEVIGIVGPSGSGKSTLTKLIQRLYLPQEGRILLDGADLGQLDPAWLRSHIGVVLQDNLLFNRTVHENIALAVPGLPRTQVIAIARLAGADEFIAKLPQGYDTMIEERGANLSGGQRQRIAIARALAPNPPILIFDEATSALDYESERIIQENMRAIVKGRTVIIIAHRLAAVRPCHRIVSMEDGAIAEVGTHDQLLALPQGTYKKLWSLQNDRQARG